MGIGKLERTRRAPHGRAAVRPALLAAPRLLLAALVVLACCLPAGWAPRAAAGEESAPAAAAADEGASGAEGDEPGTAPGSPDGGVPQEDAGGLDEDALSSGADGAAPEPPSDNAAAPRAGRRLRAAWRGGPRGRRRAVRLVCRQRRRRRRNAREAPRDARPGGATSRRRLAGPDSRHGRPPGRSHRRRRREGRRRARGARRLGRGADGRRRGRRRVLGRHRIAQVGGHRDRRRLRPGGPPGGDRDGGGRLAHAGPRRHRPQLERRRHGRGGAGARQRRVVHHARRQRDKGLPAQGIGGGCRRGGGERVGRPQQRRQHRALRIVPGLVRHGGGRVHRRLHHHHDGQRDVLRRRRGSRDGCGRVRGERRQHKRVQPGVPSRVGRPHRCRGHGSGRRGPLREQLQGGPRRLGGRLPHGQRREHGDRRLLLGRRRAVRLRLRLHHGRRGRLPDQRERHRHGVHGARGRRRVLLEPSRRLRPGRQPVGGPERPLDVRRPGGRAGTRRVHGERDVLRMLDLRRQQQAHGLAYELR